MTDAEKEVELVELELDSDYGTEDENYNTPNESKSNLANVNYPCGIITGISSTHEVEYLKNCKCDESASLPLYINYEGLVLPMGNIELSLNYLLMLRTLDVGREYKLKIYKSEDNFTEIDLNDPNTLIKFIKL